RDVHSGVAAGEQVAIATAFGVKELTIVGSLAGEVVHGDGFDLQLAVEQVDGLTIGKDGRGGDVGGGGLGCHHGCAIFADRGALCGIEVIRVQVGHQHDVCLR